MSTSPFNRSLFEIRQNRAKNRGFDNFLMRKLEEELEERVYFADALSNNRFNAVGEVPIFKKTYSLGEMQMMNDIQGFLARCKQALNPNGFFIAGFIGGESLNELHTSFTEAELEITGGVTPHIHPFIDVKTAGSLLQHSGFTLPVVDSDRLTIRYSSAFSLIKEINQSGYNSILNARSKKFMRKDVLKRACEIYEQRFTENGKVNATLEVLWMSGKKANS
jgi:hypothetical protein